MTSQEYHAKRKEVLERFGDFNKMSELAKNNVYMNKVVSCLIYGEENEYDLILDLIRAIEQQSSYIRRLHQTSSQSIIFPNDNT